MPDLAEAGYIPISGLVIWTDRSISTQSYFQFRKKVWNGGQPFQNSWLAVKG